MFSSFQPGIKCRDTQRGRVAHSALFFFAMNIERTELEFDEIHKLMEASILKAGEQMPADDAELEKTPEDDIIEDLLGMLIMAYERGHRDVNEMLETDLPVDDKRMYEVIYHTIDGKTFEDRARTHIREEDPGRLIDLAESEYHRVYNTSGNDTAETSGLAVTKTWVTMMDDRVRETHDFLEGVTLPLAERFYTIDGDSARFPGDFMNAENNVNCRCLLLFGRA